MPQIAERQDFRVVGSSGALGIPGFVTTAEQAQRWGELGFDLVAALDRQRAFAAEYHAISDYKKVGGALQNYGVEAQQRAIEQGVPADDPDFWMIMASLKSWS